MTFKIEGEEMYPIFVLASVVSSLRSGKVWQACAQQRKTIPTQTPQFHVKFMYMTC